MFGVSNYSATIALRQLESVQETAAQTTKRISSGLAVADAYDDGASWAVVTRISSYSAAIGALTERRQNLLALTDFTHRTMQTSYEQLRTLREKATLAADTSLVGEQRRHVQDSFNATRDRLTAAAQEATFNSHNLIDGVGANRVSMEITSRSFNGGPTIQPEPGEQFFMSVDFKFDGEQAERMRGEIAYRYEWDDGSGNWQQQDLMTDAIDPTLPHGPGSVATLSSAMTIPTVTPAAVQGRIVATLSGQYPLPDGDEFVEPSAVVASWSDEVTGLPATVPGIFQVVGSTGFGSPSVSQPPAPPSGGPFQTSFAIQPTNPADTSLRHVGLYYKSTTESGGVTQTEMTALNAWTGVAANQTLSFSGNVPAPSTPGRLTSGALVVAITEANGTGITRSVPIASWEKVATLPNVTFETRTWATKLDAVDSPDGDQLPIRETDLTARGLGLDTASLATAEDAQRTLVAIDKAEATLGKWSQRFSDLARSFVKRIDFEGYLLDAHKQGMGAIADADLAKESARQQSNTVRLQLTQNGLSLANQQPTILLKLFGM